MLLLLTGCAAPTVWTRAGAGEEAMNADFVECRRASRLEAHRQFGPTSAFGLTGPPAVSGRRAEDPARLEAARYRQRLDDDRLHAETRLANACMRDKGYERAPA